MSTPPFFCIIFTSGSYERIKIPLPFIHKTLEGQTLPENVSLKDRYGNIWQVKVSKTNGDFYFTNGWSELVSDNSIIIGDLLVFEYYSSENLFTFKLMERSGIEKEGLGSFIDNVPRENQNTNQEDYNNNDNDDGFERMNEETFLQFRTRARENIAQEDQNVDNENSDNQNEDIDADEDDEADDGSPRPQVDNYGKYYGMDIFNAGLARQPRNPYFVAKFADNRKCDMLVPSKVIKDHNLDLNQHLEFVDPSERRYPAKYKKWQDGRVRIAGGWRALQKKNNVREGHTYICEFIQRRNRNLDLSISFVRQ